MENVATQFHSRGTSPGMSMQYLIINEIDIQSEKKRGFLLTMLREWMMKQEGGGYRDTNLGLCEWRMIKFQPWRFVRKLAGRFE
jgi:hypothetical protein